MIRNNNPGNIRAGEKWQGASGTDSRGFIIFSSLPYGYRALYKLLSNYIDKGYNTIEKIITRWAPPAENDTENYIKNVSKWTGIDRKAKLTKVDLYTLGLAISRMEHGEVNKEAAKNGIMLISPGKNDSSSIAGGTLLPLLLLLGAGLLLYTTSKG